MRKPRIGIVGGGVAGSTIAIALAELGLPVVVFEKSASLISGPPMCHLHAGGNLYREISDEQCLDLLNQSIDIARLYPHSIDVRPTVIAVPTRDKGVPEALVPRLNVLVEAYRKRIADDPQNQVFGAPEDYFRLYSQADIAALAQRPWVEKPVALDDWMIPLARTLTPDTVKYPLVMVQEYGWNIFRLAATATQALELLSTAEVKLNTTVTQVEEAPATKGKGNAWLIHYDDQHHQQVEQVDYLINACGFRTGTIDDMVAEQRERMVEFKASYLSHWPAYTMPWPEVIFHGERGTPQGMAQLTPYGNGYYQIHGMTEDITLFEDGLVKTTQGSAQPKLDARFLQRIDDAWQPDTVARRTERAIDHVAYFLPAFSSAQVGGNPLFGGQQIPGDDADLRVADMSFTERHYARCENVKANSSLAAAASVVAELQRIGLLGSVPASLLDHLTVTRGVDLASVHDTAVALAGQRGFPELLAHIARPLSLNANL